MSEKCIAEIKLWLPEHMKRDLQDLADQDDRKTSELIRVVLEDWLYGAQRRLCRAGTEGAHRTDKGRPA